MAKSKQPPRDKEPVVGLRIIGGDLRGRKLRYSGDQRTRPMKDRVREAVFNLLGHDIAGSLAIDLFAGTGALGLEAISRGASRAIFIERHWPTARMIEQNAEAIGVRDRAEVVFGDAFAWSTTFVPPAGMPLTVFCSPPYDFYVERCDAMVDLVRRWANLGAEGSLVVVEADERFDAGLLPRADEWDIRKYPPALVAIYRRTDAQVSESRSQR
jgi:16S rRNA (guanine(966)-N(2))-methyltransferase RsmD